MSMPNLQITVDGRCKPVSMCTTDGKELKKADGPPPDGTITSMETITIMTVKVNPDCYWVFYGGQWHWICV